jgi:hypothetical protein
VRNGEVGVSVPSIDVGMIELIVEVGMSILIIIIF